MLKLLSWMFFLSVFSSQIFSQSKTQEVTPSKKLPTTPSSPGSQKVRPAIETELNSSKIAQQASQPNDAPSIAINLARSIGRQANIEKPIDRIRVMLQSAKLLSQVSAVDSRYLVSEAASLLLDQKKKETNELEQKKIAAIENEIVALYSSIDPEQADKFIKEAVDITAEKVSNSKINDAARVANVRAEKMVDLASVLIEAGNQVGVDVLLSSISETGRVGSSFYAPLRTVVTKPELRDRLTDRIKPALSGRIIAEPNDLSFLALAVLYVTGKNSSCAVVNATILELEINSLKQIELTVRLAIEQGQPLPFSRDALDYLGGMFVSSLREQYVKWLPSRLEEVDLCLKSLQAAIPFKIVERKQREKAETFEEKFAKASSTILASNRERELVNLAFDVLNNRLRSDNLSSEQMLDKILSAFNSNESKSLVADAKIIVDIKSMAKDKRYREAANEARRLSHADWQAQVLAGLASALEASDKEAARQYYHEALNVLNVCKPNTAVIRTTLQIAEQFYGDDLRLGRETLSNAIKYANQTDFSENGIRSAFDRNLFAMIGSITLAIGYEPGRIQDALRDSRISKLAQRDWQAVYDLSNNIENKMLRAVFQLNMCEGFISQAAQDTPVIK